MAGYPVHQCELFDVDEQAEVAQPTTASSDQRSLDVRVTEFLKTLEINEDSTYNMEENPPEALALGAMMEQRGRALRILVLAHVLVSGFEHGRSLQSKRRGEYQEILRSRMSIYKGAWVEFAGAFGFAAVDQARAFVCEAGGY